MWSVHDLIVAPATPPGPGPRAIVRIAGDGLERLIARLFSVERPGLPEPGEPPLAATARLAADVLGREWGELTVGILFWPGPAGPLGGPLAEVQLPGSTPLVEAVVAAACDAGARLARGGEFTLRGFLAGRLDLVQAEAVLAVVDARTPGELSAALDRMAGGAGGDLREARATLLDLLADIEAEIDFADEATPDAVPRADAAVWLAMDRRLAEATAGVHDAATRLRLRDAGAAELPRVVLAGRPNIGKSSLFNALVGRDAALVADESGTTRDWIEAPLPAADDVSAPPICVVVDLAGLPAAAGVGIAQDHPDSDAAAVESAAVAAARREIARADLIVICRDAADSDDRDFVEHACGVAFDVRTRCDRVPQPVGPGGTAAIATSTVTGCGVEELAQAIRAAVAGLPPRSSPATLRMAAGLAAAAGPLAAASEAVGLAAAGGPIDEAVVAGQVRRAVEALGEVTGVEIGTDLLDRIFSRHCIGK